MQPEPPKEQTLRLADCQRKLTIPWFIGAGLFFLFLFAQTITNKYADKTPEVWTWAMQSFIPILSLILSGLIAQNSDPSLKDRPVDSFFFKLSYYVSFFYLFILFATVLSAPFAGSNPVDFYKRANLLLTPIQGVLTTSIGVFFLKKG